MSKQPLQDLISPARLKTFLNEAPLLFGAHLSAEDKELVLTNCYRSLWSNDLELQQKYFFSESEDNLTQLLKKYHLLKSDGDQEEEEPEYFETERGKQCGHLFKKGESVYRCRNCGLDDTCVMCSKCFHASNHEGHDVKIWISKGAGGCCDCGDPEAWKIPLQCTIHCLAESVHASPELSTEPLSSVPPPLMDSIRETIAVVFDYMMETFATSPEELFTIGSVQDIRQECIDSHDALGLPYDGEEQLYACVLWNDEKHSFDEVITVVQTAIGCTEEEADNAAKRVDLYGRFVLKVSKNIDELIMAAKTVNHIGLAVTVCSVQKTIREDISGLLLDWLKDLISGRYRFFSNVTAGNCIIRDSICQVLAAEWALTPDLAWLSTRYRRHRMNDDEDDDFHDEDSSSDDGVTEMAAFAAFGGDHDDGLVDFEDDIMLEDDEDDDDDEEDDDLEEEAVESSGDEEYEDAAEDMQIEQTSDEHDVETRSHFIAPVLDADSPERSSDALKRRRLSGSSQPTSNKTYRMRDILDIDWDLDGWLAHVEKLEKSEREIVKDFGIPVQADSSSVQINHQLKKEFRKKIRLDYLLQFDLRLWKTARVNIKDLLIGTFVSNFDYRPIIGTRFVRNYPELVDAFFFKDREPENSISTLSVQLLTVPTVASMLVKDFKFFSIVCSILSNFFLTDHMYMILPEMYENAQVNCSSRAISRHRYVYTFFDLRYIMNTDQVKLEIADNPLYLGHFINLIFQFQAMDPLRRKVNTHVEYESNSWVNAFNMTLQISKLCRQFAGCYDFGQPEGSVSEVEASRNLCRAIYRILKAIVDWNPHLLKNDKPDRSTIIKGIAHQNFHTVTSSVAGSYQIVDYNVSSDYTSFHHPYHWLLSELFENIHLLNDNLLNQLGWVGGFKQMVHEAFSTKEHAMFLMVLEYPIRTLTMLSQINCGVWVRNGFSIRNQSNTYREITIRENTLDNDIYLVQVGLIVCDCNQLLLTLIDRYQLLDWFNGKPAKGHSTYDNSQKIFMVEELLHLLIMCATEHANASGATPEQKIRRSIVQYLAINNMAYSELLKLIPESLNEHESFEIQLNEMATFRPPDGLDDKGLYELKPEYLDQLNPYFWHYSRNQREEACEILKLRANRLDPSLKLTQKDEYLHVPKPSPIKGSPFKELGSFLHSHVLCQMVLYSIWNYKMSTQVKSDTILDEAVYLCLLAVTDPNSTANEVMNAGNKQYQDLMVEPVTTFVEHAVNDNYSIQINELERGKATLLTVLIRCIDDPQMAHVHKRLKFIVEKIHYYGSDAVKKRIDDWRHDRIQSAASTADNSDAELSEYERKKAAAKARQASIMSQFANAQAKFMEAHQGLYTEEEDGNDKGEEMDYQNASGISEDNMQVGDDVEVVRKCHFPVDSCIVCQEELEDTKLYGMLGFIQKSNIQRTVPMDNNDIFAEILKASGQENPWRVQDNQEKQEPFCGYPTEAHNAGMDVSTCGHLMHAECFRTYQESVDNQLVAELRRAANISPTIKNRFLCPLCKALGNILLPIVWKGKKEVYPGVTVPTTEYQDIIKVAKDASADLKSKFDGGGSDGQGTPFVNTDPNMTIKDPEKLKHFYNQLITIIFKTTGTAHADIMFNDGDFSMGKAIYDMYRLYAYTISDFEIAQRGIEGTRARDLTVEHTGTFIDDVPSTSQTLLKILGMTYDLIPKVMVSNWDAIQFLVKESLALEALDQLIPFESSNLSYSLFNLKPLLMDDMFEVLVRIGFSLSDYPAIQIHHILRALYLADITKTVIAVVQKIVDQQDHGLSNDLNELNAKHESFPSTDAITHKFVSHVMRLAGMTADSVDRFFSIVRPGALTSIVRTFTLPFLRKALLFMVVYHGFIPQNPGNDDFEEVGEYERLLETLRLPNPETLFELESTDRDFIADWCKDYKQYSLSNSIIEPEKAVMKPLTLNLPTQFRMVTLPYRLDQLLDESSKRACLKCKTVPEHSAVCLICGRFVCARRFCCTEGNRGECNLHMKTCGGEIGIYMIVKECFVLLLHENGGGSIMGAPYLDSHGEADIFFKRGSPQYLNMKRYEQIRRMWLNQSIPAYIRRKMEVTYNTAAWEYF